MKILMSLGIFYPSQVGGPSNTLYWLGKELVRHGITVTVISSDLGVASDFAKRDQWFNLDGIMVKYCKTRWSNSSPKLAINGIIQVFKNDIIMLSSLFYKPNFIIAIVALIAGKRIIWSPRGELFVKRSGIKKLYLKIIKAIFARKVTFHATSPEEKETILHILGTSTNCIIIPNYMALPQKLDIVQTENYLLYVGRIAPIKALEKLIEGISLSREFSRQKFKLYLAGKAEGDYYNSLIKIIKKKKITSKVLFKGMVEGEDKELLYAGAKATLLMSHSENFGNVIIESLAQGTPVIASKGTPWEILNDTQSGFWIDNSPEIIASYIDELLIMPIEDYQQLRENAYDLCLNNFDIKKNIKEWLKIINQNV